MTQNVITRPAKSLAKTVKLQAKLVGGSLAAAWATFAANFLVGGALLPYGIIPRTASGLRGILFAPFLHVNASHLLANTASFAILGWLVTLRDPKHFGRVTLIAALSSGLLSWLLGAPGSVHVGASGVIFGFLGFLMMSGWYARTVASVLLSIGVTALWGGLVFGVLPTVPGVSWQGHLGGFIGGVLAARAFRK